MNIPSNVIKCCAPVLGLGVPALLFACLLAPPIARSAPQLVPVRVASVNVDLIFEAPPPPRHEVIVERERPSRDHVWVPGYWIGRQRKHEWVPGHWERPPHGRTLWVEPRWEKRDRGYVFVEGFWAEPHHDDHDRDHH